MKTIWKFELEIDDTVTIQAPGHPVDYLSVEIQNGKLCLWAIVDDFYEMETRKLFIRGTGAPLGNAQPKQYIGTAHDTARGLVWHVFDGSPR